MSRLSLYLSLALLACLPLACSDRSIEEQNHKEEEQTYSDISLRMTVRGLRHSTPILPGDRVAVKVGDTVRAYVFQSDSTLAPDQGEKPFRIGDKSKSVLLTAWAPFSETEPDEWMVSVPSDQRSKSSFAAADVIYAQKRIQDGETVDLDFRHLTANVQVVLTTEDYIDETTAVSVELLVKNGPSPDVAVKMLPLYDGKPQSGTFACFSAFVPAQVLAPGSMVARVSYSGRQHSAQVPTGSETFDGLALRPGVASVVPIHISLGRDGATD